MKKHGQEKHWEFREHNEKHDAYYCSKCDIWLENQCGDDKCRYCPNRPEKPSQVKKSMIQ